MGSIEPENEKVWEVTVCPPPPCEKSQHFIVQLAEINTERKRDAIRQLTATLTCRPTSTQPLGDPTQLSFWIQKCSTDESTAHHHDFNRMMNLLLLVVHLQRYVTYYSR